MFLLHNGLLHIQRSDAIYLVLFSTRANPEDQTYHSNVTPPGVPKEVSSDLNRWQHLKNIPGKEILFRLSLFFYKFVKNAFGKGMKSFLPMHFSGKLHSLGVQEI